MSPEKKKKEKEDMRKKMKRKKSYGGGEEKMKRIIYRVTSLLLLIPLCSLFLFLFLASPSLLSSSCRHTVARCGHVAEPTAAAIAHKLSVLTDLGFLLLSLLFLFLSLFSLF